MRKYRFSQQIKVVQSTYSYGHTYNNAKCNHQLSILWTTSSLFYQNLRSHRKCKYTYYRPRFRGIAIPRNESGTGMTNRNESKWSRHHSRWSLIKCMDRFYKCNIIFMLITQCLQILLIWLAVKMIVLHCNCVFITWISWGPLGVAPHCAIFSQFLGSALVKFPGQIIARTQIFQKGLTFFICLESLGLTFFHHGKILAQTLNIVAYINV